MEEEQMFPPRLRLTEPNINWQLDDGLINGVITAAVWSVDRRPGVWGKMMVALEHAVKKTEEGTVDAFLFQAMVDRLLEEFHALDSHKTSLRTAPENRRCSL